MKKRALCKMAAIVGMAAMMAVGCSSSDSKNEDGQKDTKKEDTAGDDAPEDDADEEENYDTGDASLDNTRNEDGIGEKELLVVSFGTSFNDSRRMTIGGIEAALEKNFSDYSVRRGFTSQIIIDHVKKRDNVAIDNVKEALDRAVDNGVKTLVIQPTHLMNGLEYNDVVDEVAAYADQFDKVVIGQPLLTSDADYDAVVKAITDATKDYDDGRTAICFMGHGTEAESNAVYAKMQDKLTAGGFNNYYVGTVEAEPTLDDVVAMVKEGGYEKVVLSPLMIVAGDHANNDMAGDEDDTWKKTFEKEGFEVEIVMNDEGNIRGLGELEAIQNIFVQHAQEAIDSLNQQ